MITWLLILQIYVVDDGVTVSQVGPFASESACVAAGEAAKGKLTGQVRFSCVASS